MTRWEYVVDAVPTQGGMSPFLAMGRADQRGEAGWELVSVIVEGGNFLLWFKRPKEASDAERASLAEAGR